MLKQTIFLVVAYVVLPLALSAVFLLAATLAVGV